MDPVRTGAYVAYARMNHIIMLLVHAQFLHILVYQFLNKALFCIHDSKDLRNATPRLDAQMDAQSTVYSTDIQCATILADDDGELGIEAQGSIPAPKRLFLRNSLCQGANFMSLQVATINMPSNAGRSKMFCCI